jgi:transposase-like protein
VREGTGGWVIANQAVMIAIAVDFEGRRNVLAVELANRESQSSWREFCMALKERGLQGVELVISDDHAGLRKAIAEVFTEAVWQRCYAHFLRNALDFCRGRANNDCLTELRWIYDRCSIAKARQDLAAWLRSGAALIPSYVTGWTRTSKRRSRSIACRDSITKT